jgi:hypothetical protein
MAPVIQKFAAASNKQHPLAPNVKKDMSRTTTLAQGLPTSLTLQAWRRQLSKSNNQN